MGFFLFAATPAASVGASPKVLRCSRRCCRVPVACDSVMLRRWVSSSRFWSIEMNSHARSTQRLALVRSAPISHPPYLHRRGRSFYFKRKIPVDCVDAFPGLHGQVWKSLETTLFERARVMLAVEVSEFDMLVARHQNERATRLASVTPLSRAATVQVGRRPQGHSLRGRCR